MGFWEPTDIILGRTKPLERDRQRMWCCAQAIHLVIHCVGVYLSN